MPCLYLLEIARADFGAFSKLYDNLGQVTSGVHHWSDASPVAGQQFAYTVDHIGNRTQSQSGGDNYGVNRRFSTYAPNLLNQYVSRKVPDSVDIVGTAHADSTVTVDITPTTPDGTATQRKNDYFRAEVAIDNSMGVVFDDDVTIRGVRWNGTQDVLTEETRTIIIPPATQSFTYDEDGNLLTDGIWTHVWDAENRLTSVSATSQRKLEFKYDYLGRRVQKDFARWSSGTWGSSAVTNFIYDGWNLIAELDGNNNNAVLRSYMWGIDASGTISGAGGVGGLLAMRVHSGPNAGTYFYVYDGNHNIVGLVNAATGASAAEYIYGPFGELLRATGPLAFENPFRFSTKYCDDETGFLYYGFRYYDGAMGRWLSRDPLEEAGGIAVLVMSVNDVINHFDPLGLKAITLSFDFASDTLSPLGATKVQSLHEMIATIEKTVHCCDCIQLLRIGSHGSPGRINLGTPGQSPTIQPSTFDFHQRAVQNPLTKRVPQVAEAFNIVEALGRINGYLCPDGRVEFISCSSFESPAGADLQNRLEGVFGNNSVLGYQFPVKWGLFGCVYRTYTKPNGQIYRKEKVSCK